MLKTNFINIKSSILEIRKILNKNLEKNSGITIISLVVSIVVLLILAGVSIAMLNGENGIVMQAMEAKKKAEIVEYKEGIELSVITLQGYAELTQSNLQKEIDSQFGEGKATVVDNGDGTFTVNFYDLQIEYNVSSNGVENEIDWNNAMKKAKAPESQNEERNNGVVGIGTDGKTVDMDLWEYTLLEDGTYGLNTKEAYNNSELGGNNEIDVKGKAYLGEYTSKGEIIGTIPQYIYNKEREAFLPVTSLYLTFYNDINLKVSPKIPSTVKILWGTFIRSSLENCPNIGNNVVNMRSTFHGCKNLKNANIGRNVTILDHTFRECSSLQNISDIPNGVVSMDSTFRECGLTKCEIIIPSSVKNMQATFSYCTKLCGRLIVNADLDENLINSIYPSYSSCLHSTNTDGEEALLISGTCKLLTNLYQTKSVNSNIIMEH